MCGKYCLQLVKCQNVLKFGNVWEVLLIAGKVSKCTEVWECVEKYCLNLEICHNVLKVGNVWESIA
jgi:hypothetical protein